MSEVYPYGFHPASSTVPPKWTNEAGQPGIVQFNGLVYVKTERHTGGTGKPNEEEVDGIRTWRLYTTNEPSTANRYLWSHLHIVFRHYTPDAPVYDEDCYEYASNYFFLYPNNLTASIDQNKGRVAPSTLRVLEPYDIRRDNYSFDAASGIFDWWVGDPNLPAPNFRYVTPGGWASSNPDYPDIPPVVPDPNPPIEKTVLKYIWAYSPIAVGKTYTGYIERIEATASWQINPDTGLHQYTYNTPYVAEQIPISYTVTQQNYIDYIEGNSPTIPSQTYTTYGGLDLWAGWGYVILTGVSPSAND